jgi:hypothetical protein
MKFTDIKYFNAPNYRVCVQLTEVKHHIEGYIRKYDLTLDPEYQRGYVWTVEQQSKFLEYLFQGGVSGREIYFNCPGFMGDSKQMEVVDGKQRLKAVIDFLDDKVRVFGALFSEFEDEIPYYIELYFNVHKLRTQLEVVDWYLSMNRGGSVHTEDDLEPAYNLKNKLINL